MTTTPTTSSASPERLRQIHRGAEHRAEAYLQLLADLVHIDSGSLDLDGVRRISDVLEGILTAEGFHVERIPAGGADVLVARKRGEGPTILLNAHFDTVYDPGTASERPFSVDGRTAHGPGVADDKCGIVSAIMAAQILAEVGAAPNLMLVLTPDEELGSPASAEAVAHLAAKADVGLCLEAARATGELVSARKGGANLTVTFTGRAAHSGVEPEKGINAALQMGRAIVELDKLNDPDRGITVNVGLARAGTRSNVIPAKAVIWIDLRAWTVEDFDEVLAAAERIVSTPYVPGVKVEIVREAEAPPMEATDANLALAGLAQQVAGELAFDVDHVGTGGMGDVNVLASAGIPVLDGLAPVGGDDHTPDEWLDVTTIVPRVALLAGLIDRLASDGVPG